ncbi:GNAT family N-acetyltransferase [Cerasicoccus maritimus]|uniref:GNAT family N-acetyltransferase n=1 Tax=Cerasicoccus maritimus TaxID=490089 RepID=UPI00285253F1|nr:GNAT family N-acetyltransferase [Cerasicoccus maritimus]
MAIRLAQESDLNALVELLRQLTKVERDFAFNAEKQRTGLKLLLDKPDAYILVAEVSGVVAAMATIQELISTTEGGVVGLIEDVVVHYSFRGKGVGRQMMDHLKATAEVKGYHRLQLLADMHNPPAEAFYQKQNYRPTSLKQWRWRVEAS